MKKISYAIGFFSSVALLSLYAVTMTLLSGWDAAVEQFQALWWLMLPLAIGFGIQVSLYTIIKETVKQKTHAALAAGGTSAGASMLACCAHHATDALPYLGISGASVLLTAYQIPLLGVSLVINIIGIFVMLRHLQKIAL